MRSLVLFIFFIFISTSTHASAEVFYCVEEKSIGFKDKNEDNNYIETNFYPERFKAKINFERPFFESSDLSFYASQTECSDYGDFIQCTSFGYSININKKNYNFVVSQGFGHAGGSKKDSINIAYGTCEKF